MLAKCSCMRFSLAGPSNLFFCCQTDKTEKKIGKEVGSRQRKKRQNSILGKEHVSEMLSVRQLMTKTARPERQSECELLVWL